MRDLPRQENGITGREFCYHITAIKLVFAFNHRKELILVIMNVQRRTHGAGPVGPCAYNEGLFDCLRSKWTDLQAADIPRKKLIVLDKMLVVVVLKMHRYRQPVLPRISVLHAEGFIEPCHLQKKFGRKADPFLELAVQLAVRQACDPCKFIH